MSNDGTCIVTRQGRELMAKVLAAGKPLEFTRVMVGSGAVTEGADLLEFTALIAPVAAATTTIPNYDGDTIHMTVQFRSDLNGGLENGFWLNEFGVFASDGESDSEVMLLYGTLGDYPQYVRAHAITGTDVRCYPLSIIIGEGGEVTIDYRAEAWMTAEDVAEYCTVTILPLFLVEAQKLINLHNASKEAHPYILGLIGGHDARLSLLELRYMTDVKGNPFMVTFENLEGTDVTGVWNSAQERVEF